MSTSIMAWIFGAALLIAIGIIVFSWWGIRRLQRTLVALYIASVSEVELIQNRRLYGGLFYIGIVGGIVLLLAGTDAGTRGIHSSAYADVALALTAVGLLFLGLASLADGIGKYIDAKSPRGLR